MAALGLITNGTLMGKTPAIPINALPFTITAPGTYVVTGNLTFSAPATGSYVTAITVPTSLSGPVVIDLGGFTLTAVTLPNQPLEDIPVGVGIGAAANSPFVSNTYPITVRNGTFHNFGLGVWAALNGTVTLTDLTVTNVTVTTDPPAVGYGAGGGISFAGVISSSVANCTFNGLAQAITDEASPGGNTYSNNIFNGCESVLQITMVYYTSGFTLYRCQVAPPPTQ
jgi:hypothetical protein